MGLKKVLNSAVQKSQAFIRFVILSVLLLVAAGKFIWGGISTV